MEDISFLVERCQRGDANAIVQILSQHRSLISGILSSSSAQSKLESLQADPNDFFLYAYEKLKNGRKFQTYDLSKPFDNWFAVVIFNLFHDFTALRRHHQSESPFDYARRLSEQLEIDEWPDDYDSPEVILLHSEERQHIEKLFAELNHTDKAILLLQNLAYRSLRPEDVEFLIDYTGKSAEYILKAIRSLEFEIIPAEEQRIRKKDAAITNRYLEIRNLESQEKELIETIEYGSGDTGQLTSRLSKIQTRLVQKRRTYSILSNIKKRGGHEIKVADKYIAEILGISIGTVTSALSRLKQKLEQFKRDNE